MEPKNPERKRLLKFVRPQHEWRWQIAVYLYLAGMGAGAFSIGLLFQWFGFRIPPSPEVNVLGLYVDLSRAVFLWGPVLVAIGAPFLILDLGIKRRFLYACLNPRTSWVARGFLILSTFIVIGLLVFALSLLPSGTSNTRPMAYSVLEAIAFVFGIATAIYTGILLKSVKYIPVWNTSLLPTLFLVSALSTGSMLTILSTLTYGLGLRVPVPGSLLQKLTATEQILILIEAGVLALYLWSRYQMKDQAETSVRILLLGELKLLFWGGIVVVGFLFPIVLELIYSRTPENAALLFVTGVFLLTGGFFLRLGILAAGVKEQLPMHKLMEVKYQLATSVKTKLPIEKS